MRMREFGYAVSAQFLTSLFERSSWKRVLNFPITLTNKYPFPCKGKFYERRRECW
jgi:hypothetical protein